MQCVGRSSDMSDELPPRTAAVRRRHPLRHAAMRAIESVAGSQRQLLGYSTCKKSACVEASVLQGVKGVQCFCETELKRAESSTAVDSEVPLETAPSQTSSELFIARSNGNGGPYLCTGYDVYLVKEPCCMYVRGLTRMLPCGLLRIFF
jgi:hypothetical protein